MLGGKKWQRQYENVIQDLYDDAKDSGELYASSNAQV